VNYEEITILTDCKALTNATSLTYLFEDHNNLEALTPAVFIQNIQKGVPDLDCNDKVNFSKRFWYQHQLWKELKRRFRLDYLGQLIQQSKEMSCRT
jgi:hypothetical protein